MGGLGIGLALGLLLLGGAVCWLLRRRNRSRVHPLLAGRLQHWDVVSDGLHNAGADLIGWRHGLLLAHQVSEPRSVSARSCIRVRRSADGHTWEFLAELSLEGQRVGAPRLVVIGDRLFLYAHAHGGGPGPARSVLATSDDGRGWSGFAPVGPRDCLLGRPARGDGGSGWYVAAGCRERGRTLLLHAPDGRDWQELSTIAPEAGGGEAALAILSDGRMQATLCRDEAPAGGVGGAPRPDEEAETGAGTLLARAEPPYRQWRARPSTVARLDGAVLLPHAGRVFAVGRYQPGPRGRLTRLGSRLSRKRTALYEVLEDRLAYLSDLPSAGDTGRAGALIRGDSLWVAYQTNAIHRDVPWLLGRALASDIRMARLPVDALTVLADAVGA